MSIRYINSNDLINDVPDYLQNIINNMDCVYIDGIKPNNQHFNLVEHDKQIRADAIDEIAHKLKETFNNEFPSNYHCTRPYFTLDNVRVLVDAVAKEQK